MTAQILTGQIQYTNHFTQKLKKSGADFIAPVEGFYKIKMPKKRQMNPYDLALESEEHALEIGFILKPNLEVSVPHVYFMAAVSSLAINDEQFDIRLNMFAEEVAQAQFHAEWAAYADFVPKSSLTDKYYGRIVCLYREGTLLQTVMFFNRQDEEKDKRMYSLSFLPMAASPLN
jgi:hypothetical protein